MYPEELISAAVRKNKVPNKPGVYVISARKPSFNEVIYIGRAGTVLSDGNWKKQGLGARLTKKQSKEARSLFFKRYINEQSLTALHFDWFVTASGDSETIPALAEAQLLQEFYCENRRLPQLNSCA